MVPIQTNKPHPTLLPPVVARLLQFSEGDRVQTQFGPGIFASNRKYYGNNGYEIQLDSNAKFYSQTDWIVPDFPVLTGNEIPQGVQVITGDNKVATVEYYNVKLKVYTVAKKNGQQEFYQADEIKFAPETRCLCSFGLGYVLNYNIEYDNYAVRLDIGCEGFIQPSELHAVDFRILQKIPKPLTATEIFDEFNGQLSMEQAQAFSAANTNMYLTLKSYCEQNSNLISNLANNLAYGQQYFDLASNAINTDFMSAANRVRDAGVIELQKLSTLADQLKQKLENQTLNNKELLQLSIQSNRVLQDISSSPEIRQFGKDLTSQLQDASQSQEAAGMLNSLRTLLENRLQEQELQVKLMQNDHFYESIQNKISTSSLKSASADFLQFLDRYSINELKAGPIAHLNPVELLQQAEQYIPNLSIKVAGLIEDGEQYIAKLQNSKQGQTLIAKAKKIVNSKEESEKFQSRVASVVSNIHVDKLASWSNKLAVDPNARQKLVDKVKNHCLDFLMSVLPSIEIKPIVGTKDQVDYSISDLDLSRFHVVKETVHVKLGTGIDEEVLVMRATNISSVIPGLKWSFSQKYFPYLHGAGTADAVLNGGTVSLGFKAEKHLIDSNQYKPMLALSSIEIDIKEDFKLTINGSWFSAVYNLLASLFEELIRDYIATTLEETLIEQVTILIVSLNNQIKDYWPLLFQILQVSLDDLPKASLWRGAKPLDDIMPNEDDITFKYANPPIELAKKTRSRASKVIKVDTTITATNTAKQCEEWSKIPLHVAIVGINNFSCTQLTSNEIKKLLCIISAPYTIRFAFDTQDNNLDFKPRRKQLRKYVVQFPDGQPLGIRVKARPFSTYGAIVSGFLNNENGKMGFAEKTGSIRIGHIVTGINKVDLRFLIFKEILELIKSTPKPFQLSFATSPDGIFKLEDWPPLLKLDTVIYTIGGNGSGGDGGNGDGVDVDVDDDKNDPIRKVTLPLQEIPYVIVSGFQRVPSFAKNCKLIAEYDVVTSINNESALYPSLMAYDVAMNMFKQCMLKQPFVAGFASKSDVKDQHNLEGVKKVEENVQFPKGPMGILFGLDKDGYIYVKRFIPGVGSVERNGLIYKGCALLQICGQNIETTNVDDVNKQIETATAPYSLTVRDLDLERSLYLKL